MPAFSAFIIYRGTGTGYSTTSARRPSVAPFYSKNLEQTAIRSDVIKVSTIIKTKLKSLSLLCFSFCARQHVMLRSSHILVIVEASVCLSVHSSIRSSVTLWYCVNATQARITKSSPWTATETLVLGSVKLFSFEFTLLLFWSVIYYCIAFM